MKVLVHLHLYYLCQLDYFLDKLANITAPQWHLVVTWSTQDENARCRLLKFKEDTEFVEVENEGYDVWPFIKLMNSGKYDDYDYVIKLHTKSIKPGNMKVNGIRMGGYGWRNALIDPLIGCEENFKRLDSIFESEPRTGMVCSVKLYGVLDYWEDHCALGDELAKLGLSDVKERRFCIGTMFAARVNAMKVPSSRMLELEDLQREEHIGYGGTPAHVYERVLSILPVARGYRVHTVGSDFNFVLRNAYRRSVGRLVKWVFSVERDQLTDRKYLKLFGIKSYLS